MHLYKLSEQQNLFGLCHVQVILFSNYGLLIRKNNNVSLWLVLWSCVNMALCQWSRSWVMHNALKCCLFQTSSWSDMQPSSCGSITLRLLDIDSFSAELVIWSSLKRFIAHKMWFSLLLTAGRPHQQSVEPVNCFSARMTAAPSVIVLFNVVKIDTLAAESAAARQLWLKNVWNLGRDVSYCWILWQVMICEEYVQECQHQYTG